MALGPEKEGKPLELYVTHAVLPPSDKRWWNTIPKPFIYCYDDELDAEEIVFPKNKMAMLLYQAASRKAKYKEAREEKKGILALLDLSMELSPECFESLYYSSSSDIEKMIVEAAEKKERKAYKAYCKAKTCVRDLLRKFWYERIRFASRAIGNENDFSLVTVPTPPTTEPTDEYFEIIAVNVHRWGGARVGCLA